MGFGVWNGWRAFSAKGPAMRNLLFTGLIVLLSGPVFAQDSLSYLMRVEGHATEAAILERLVDLKMSPRWSKIVHDPKRTETRDALAKLLSAFAGTAEVDARRMHTGMMMATLDEQKGKLALRINLKSNPSEYERKHTLAGMERTAEALEEVVRKRKTMRLEIRLSALRDGGSDVYLTLPSSRSWSKARIEQIFRVEFNAP